MKESPQSDYLLEIWELKRESEPEVSRYTDSGWVITINHLSSVVFMPYLPTSPWPPLHLDDLEHARSQDEAALVTFHMNTHIVTPSSDDGERQEELVHSVHGTQTVFFVSHAHYDALDEEISALQQRPLSPGAYDDLRLSQLGDGPLRAFLTRDLPRSAALSDYERGILCLGPLQEYI